MHAAAPTEAAPAQDLDAWLPTFRGVVNAALAMARTSDGRLRVGQRARALHDTELDSVVTALSGFQEATTLISESSALREHIEPADASRIVLQFVYDFLGNSTNEFDESMFHRVWTSFKDETRRSEWRFLTICNLDGFSAEGTVRLDDGVVIRTRAHDELLAQGFTREHLTALAETWAGGNYVLTIEERIKKTPENFVLASTGRAGLIAQRALTALRLGVSGGVYVAEPWLLRGMLLTRVAGAGFPTVDSKVGIGTRFWDSPMTLRATDLPTVLDFYRRLGTLETMNVKPPYNIDVALGWFTASYDRLPLQRETQLTDLITAIEAVVGTDTEISFRLAYRVAGILARNDDERVRIYEDLRGFYDTRSKLLHGATLKEKHRAFIERHSDLQDYVRTLLAGFLRLATSVGHGDSPKLRERLDAHLMHPAQRTSLRTAMGFAEVSDVRIGDVDSPGQYGDSLTP